MNKHRVGEIWVDLYKESSRIGARYEVIAVTETGIRSKYVEGSPSSGEWPWSVLEDDVLDETQEVINILKDYDNETL
jgi:hypothetical protein